MKRQWPATGFGARLKALREAAELTQSEVANLCGLSSGFVGRLETGGHEPSWPIVRALIWALKCKADDFIDPNESPAWDARAKWLGKPEPKKRGRPRKKEQDGPPAPKRPVGRPRKNPPPAVDVA